MTKVIKRLNIVKAGKENKEIKMDSIGGELYLYIRTPDLIDSGKQVIEVNTYQGQAVNYKKNMNVSKDVKQSTLEAIEDFNKTAKEIEKIVLKFNKEMESLMKKLGYMKD